MHVVHTEIATFRHAIYSSGARVPYHRHDCAALVYGVGGPCIETSGPAQFVKRRLTYHPVGHCHSLEYLGTTHVLAIEIESRTTGPHKGVWPEHSLPLNATLYGDIWRAMLSVADGQPDYVIENAVKTLLDNALATTLQQTPTWVLEAVNHLHENWIAVPSASMLAARLGKSPQHLCRAFRKYTGVSMQQYGLLLKIDYARGLLWGSQIPISHVAAQTGFTDQSHLTKVLANHSQRTPRGLRVVAPCLTNRLG